MEPSCSPRVIKLKKENPSITFWVLSSFLMSVIELGIQDFNSFIQV
jgi:hypothetical protein